MKMGDSMDFCLQTVENTLPKRMVDNSLIHLWNNVQKKMSKKTVVLNRKIKRLHILKSYEHYVEIKTKIKEKFNNDNEYETSCNEEFSDETSSSEMDVEETLERNEQNNQHENEHDILPKDISNNSVSVNDVDSQLTITDQENRLVIDDDSIKSPISNCNNDSIPDDDSATLTDDESNKLIIDDNSTPNIINSDNSDNIIESSKNSSNDDKENKLETLDNDDMMENRSDVFNDDDEKNETKTHDNSSEDIKNSPENNCLAENDTQDMPNNKSSLKIIMTEIIKPRYTVISAFPEMLNATEQCTQNEKSSNELLGDAESNELESSQQNNFSGQESSNNEIDNRNLINPTENEKSSNELLGDAESNELESSQQNDFSGQESSNNEIDNRNLINPTENENTITAQQTITKSHKKPRRKVIMIPDNNQNLKSHFNKETNHINSRLEGEKTSDSNINLSKETSKMLNNENHTTEYSVLNKKGTFGYILDRLPYMTQQKQLDHESESLCRNYISIENKSRDDANSEQENDTLKSNVLKKRPFTLGEFVQEYNLASLEDKSSVFTLDDLSDDDEFFLMEMPKSVIDQELSGQKMTVRNSSIMIGSTKYKLQQLKNDALTCILKENNERSSFKAVNITPKRTFVVNKAVVPSIEDNNFDQTFPTGNSRCPFPSNLKVRNPLENNNKRLKKYKKKMRKEKKRKLAESILEF